MVAATQHHASPNAGRFVPSEIDGRGATIVDMTVAVKKLDVQRGDLVEIEGRYDQRGGPALKPAVTVSADELDRRHGTRPLTVEEFERSFGALPRDPGE